MFTNRNLKTDNVGVPVEIDLSYDIGAAGVPTNLVNSSKWTLTRVSAGLYRLTAKALISQRAVTHICHSGDTTEVTQLVSPVKTTWSQASGTLDFNVSSRAGVVQEATNGSRLYLRVKQEYARVTQR